MKKVFGISALFLVLTLSGCSISNNSQTKIDNEELKKQVSDLQQEVVDLKQVNKTPNFATNTSVVAEISEVPTKKETTPSEDSLATTQATSGDNLGYIKKVYSQNGSEYLTIDYVQWLTGRDAVVASIEDGDCKIEGKTKVQAIAEAKVADFSMGLGDVFGNCTPNGYFVRNVNPMLRNFKISNDADIKISVSATSQKVSLEKFIATVNSENNNGAGALFTITLKDGLVTKIIEAYRP